MKTEIKAYLEKINPLKFEKDEKISGIRNLGTGESNLNFLIETTKGKYLMRFDITNKSQSHFRQEYEILKRLEPLNIAQKPLFMDMSKRYFNEKFLILSYIEGKSLDKLNNKDYSRYYGKLTKKIAKLHKLKISFINKEHSFEKHLARSERIIRKIKRDLRYFDNKEKTIELFEIYHKSLKGLLKDYKPILTFCHGDICLPNTLMSKREFFLIDWELSGKQDPALELSYHFYEFKYTKMQESLFLKEYLKIREDKTLKERMKFTDFFIAYTNYFDILHTCLNIANKKGHKDYLKNANLKKYWEWGEYYFQLVCKQGLFSKDFEYELKKELKEIYEKLRKL